MSHIKGDLLNIRTKVQILGADYKLEGTIVGYATMFDRVVDRTHFLYLVNLKEGFWSEKGPDRYQTYVSVLPCHESALVVINDDCDR